MAVLVIVAVLAFSQAVTAKDYNVGGTLNWDFPPGTDVGYYDTWSSQQKFVAGDSLSKHLSFHFTLNSRNFFTYPLIQS